jgi:hypothetical protein
LRLILQGVDPTALEVAFRQHASSISPPPAADGFVAVAIDGKTLRGSFYGYLNRVRSSRRLEACDAVRAAGRLV